MGAPTMRALVCVLALFSVMAPWSRAQEVKRITPGMTKAEVYQILGPPTVVRTIGAHTYYVYRNGCEKDCGTQDLVVFRGGKVAHAVLRAPGREYARTSAKRPPDQPKAAAGTPADVRRLEPRDGQPVEIVSPRASSLPVALGDASPQPAQAQPKARAAAHVPDEAKRLVVQVVGRFPANDALEVDAGTEVGAGIIVGATSENVFIATARHVLSQQGVGVRDVWVVFPGQPNDSVRATQLQGRRAGLDLAVISVPLASASALRAGLPALDRRGDVRSLKSGAPVTPVGCPQGVCWEAPSSPDRILGIDLQGIIFQTNFIAPGSSGGALFNEWWEVVGLVTEEQPPRGQAIPIDRVVDQVRHWGYPADLKKAAVPRGGYRTTVGVAMLAPSPAIDDRPPSGRVTLSSRPIPQVSWHAGLLRLAPENLAVTAGMAGVGLHLKKGRLALHPFVEAGFGRVEGRFVVDSYYVATAGGSDTVRVFNRVQDDGLGVGAGMTVEVIVLPRTILELVTGYWSFARPENASKLNNLFVGGGVRLGL